jgi:hypothetical protein
MEREWAARMVAEARLFGFFGIGSVRVMRTGTHGKGFGMNHSGRTPKTKHEGPGHVGGQPSAPTTDERAEENRLLDESLEETFPASDPVASQTFE